MKTDIGYYIAIIAANLLFLAIAFRAFSLKKNWPGAKKSIEIGAVIMVIPLVWAAIANIAAQRPVWTAAAPLLIAFLLAMDRILNILINMNKAYFMLVIFEGLFFIMAGLGMAFYAFAAGTAVGFITLGVMAGAGWAGFLDC